MAKKHKKRRAYTDEERANALAALAANAGNVARTAAQLDIPQATLRAWSTGDRHPESTQMCDQKKGPLADRLEEVAWKLAEAIPDKLADSPLQQIATSLGIVIDKMQLLRNKPTAIGRTEGADDDDVRKLTDEELHRELEKARSGAASADPRGGPESGGAA